MKVYGVNVPFAGHMYIEVEAEDEDSAIDKALNEVTISNVEGWEPLRQFNQGNVCYCPTPWEAEVEFVEDLDEEETEEPVKC